ncbi:MAG: phosphate ABC transporter permease PstA [Chthonomonas sp.]|nr:phosphate ABC transporter permease PstA [Chthonomonas sp.]
MSLDLSASPWNQRRARREKAFKYLCFGSTLLAVLFLAILLVGIFAQGLPNLDFNFLTRNSSRHARNAGIYNALIGTVWIIGLTIAISVPVGIAAGVYLEEFGKKNRFTQFIQLNIANLASVPSIIYALLGLALFVRIFSLGRSIIAGALTMSLLILPMIIVTTQEALRAVPKSYREGSLALGSTPWQAVTKQVLPNAMPGILTGVILSVSRAIGETAPLVTMGAVFVNMPPKGIGDSFTALPLQIYNWSGSAKPGFQELAATGIIVLLAVLLTMNSVAIFLRNKYQR